MKVAAEEGGGDRTLVPADEVVATEGERAKLFWRLAWTSLAAEVLVCKYSRSQDFKGSSERNERGISIYQ